MPHYPIDTETKRIIIALKDKCEQIELDNVSFECTDAKFTMNQYRARWELVIQSGKHADIYRIIGGTIEYLYSESD